MTDHVPHHLTRSGRVFYEHTVPELVRQITRLNELLERLVEQRADPVSDEPEEPREGVDP